MDNLVIVLIEHQTTINPNMPLRFLSYLDELYRRIVSGQSAKIYGSELIKVPAPEFYVFYQELFKVLVDILTPQVCRICQQVSRQSQGIWAWRF